MNIVASIVVKNGLEAIKFYEEALGLTSKHLGINPDGTLGHVEFYKNDEYIFSMAEASGSTQCLVDMIVSGEANPIMNFGIDFDTEEDVRNAFEMLSNGGRITRQIEKLPWSPCSADVIDKYGVWWYINVPGNRPTIEDMDNYFDKEKEKGNW